MPNDERPAKAGAATERDYKKAYTDLWEATAFASVLSNPTSQYKPEELIDSNVLATVAAIRNQTPPPYIGWLPMESAKAGAADTPQTCCWNCKKFTRADQDHCQHCGVNIMDEAVPAESRMEDDPWKWKDAYSAMAKLQNETFLELTQARSALREAERKLRDERYLNRIMDVARRQLIARLEQAEQDKQSALKYGAHCEERAEQAEQREADLRTLLQMLPDAMAEYVIGHYSVGIGYEIGKNNLKIAYGRIKQHGEALVRAELARLTSEQVSKSADHSLESKDCERIPTPLEDLRQKRGDGIPLDNGVLTHEQVAERWKRRE